MYIHTHCNYISSTCTPPKTSTHTCTCTTSHIACTIYACTGLADTQYTQACMHTRTHTHTHAYTHAHTTHTHTTHAHANTHTQHTHMQTRTHIHTHTQKIIHIHVKCTLTQEGISEHSLGLPKQPGSLDCRQNNSGGPHTQHMLVYTYTRPRDMQVHCSPQCIQTTTFCTITVGTEQFSTS